MKQISHTITSPVVTDENHLHIQQKQIAGTTMKARKNIHRFLWVLLIALISVPASATTILCSEFSMRADASAAGGITIIDTDAVSQCGTINALSVSVNALHTLSGASSNAFGSGSATWANAAQGQVVFDDVGWISQSVQSGRAQTFLGPDWSYTFIADLDGFFTLDWIVQEDPATTNNFGLNDFKFFWTGAGGDAILGLNTAGSLSRVVVAGVEYTVSIRNRANIGGTLGTRTAFMDGTFDWQMPMGAPVTIDIKPGSDPNGVNPSSKGVIPVAVLGSENFDATQVDFTTVAFGPSGAAPVHDGHVEDVNSDGFADMVFHFKIAETGIACEDIDATLTGETSGGDPFEATDAVKIAGCN